MEKDQQIPELAAEADAINSTLDKTGNEKSQSYAENARIERVKRISMAR